MGTELHIRVFDDVNQLAVLSLSTDGLKLYRLYRNWLIADGGRPDHMVYALTHFVFDSCESPSRQTMH